MALTDEYIIAGSYGNDKIVYSTIVTIDFVKNADESVECKNFGKLIFGAKNENQVISIGKKRELSTSYKKIFKGVESPYLWHT